MNSNDKVSSSQLWIIIVLTTIGVGIFSLPRSVAESTGTDGWITAILGGLVALLDFYIISRLAVRFPEYTLVEICYKVVGKALSIPILTVFWVYMLLIISMTMRVFGEVIKMSLLIRTPVEVILISILALALFLARGGIEPIAKFNEIIFPILFGFLLLLILLAIPRTDFTNILPFLRTEPLKLLKGAYNTTYSYGGFEFILLIIPFINKPERTFRAGITAFSILIFAYVAAIVLSLGKFGVEEVKWLVWPTLSMIRSMDVPGSFVERLEAIVMPIWTMFAFTTIVPFTYGLSILPARAFKQKDFRHFCPMVIPAIYIISLIPDNVAQSYEYLDMVTTYLGAPSVFVFPVLLLIVARFRKMGVEKNV